MSWFKGYYFLLITVAKIVCSSGQEFVCVENDMVIQSITTESITIDATSSVTPFNLNIEPVPCKPEDGYYGCDCEDDIPREMVVEENPYEVKGLIPGRFYIFTIPESPENAECCSFTVPRSASAFNFMSSTMNTLTVEIFPPTTCDPDKRSQYSNRFSWSAKAIGEEPIINVIEAKRDIDDGFNETLVGFSPGLEYNINITTEIANITSEPKQLDTVSGNFKTKIHSTTNVVAQLANEKDIHLSWDGVQVEYDGYIVKCISKHPLGDVNYTIEVAAGTTSYVCANLEYGYEYMATVETYKAGFEQEETPQENSIKIHPPPPEELEEGTITMESVRLNWLPPGLQEGYTFNVRTLPVPCEPNAAFCNCLNYGHKESNSSLIVVIIQPLYSGRSYTFAVSTLANGPLMSTPVNISVNTLPRPPVAISPNQDETTNTTVIVDVVRTDQCEDGTEVSGYLWELVDKEDGTETSDTYQILAENITISIILSNSAISVGREYSVCIYTISDIQGVPSEDAKKCLDDIKTKINAPITDIAFDESGSKVFVNWTSIEGGESIDKYIIKCENILNKEETRLEIEVNATVSSAVFDKLTPGALYAVTVNAFKEGFEQYADPWQNQKTGRTTPRKPKFDVDVNNSTQLQISWTLEGHIDSIGYRFNGSNETIVEADTSEIIVGDLNPNEIYNIMMWGIAGLNGENDYQTSTEEQYEIKQMYSAPVSSLLVTSMDSHTVQVEWQYPSDNILTQGVNNYIVKVLEDEMCIQSIVLNNTQLQSQVEDNLCDYIESATFDGNEDITLNISELNACTEYDIHVFPVNSAGSGEASSDSSLTEMGGPEGQVDFDDITEADNSIKVSWTKPEPTKCEMTSTLMLVYKDCYTKEEHITNATFTDQFEYTFPDLQPYTSHSITLLIYNDGGSNSSTSEVMTLATEPEKPAPFQVVYDDITHNEATLRWAELHECQVNGPGISYNYKYCPMNILDETEGSCQESAITVDPLVLSDLEAYYKYKCSLSAQNEKGEGERSDEEEFETKQYYPEAVSQVLVDLECRETSKTLLVSFTEPTKKNGPIIRYDILRVRQTHNLAECDDSGEVALSCTVNTCIKKGEYYTAEIPIEEDVTQIKVIAYNGIGPSSPKCQSLQELTCTDAGPDVGLIVGLTFMSIAIIIIVLGLVYAKMKGVGPFNDSDTGFNYLDGQSMEAVPVGGGDTPNNHTVAGTANAAFIKEDDIEVVESSSPIQIDQFEAYCNDIYGDSQYKMAEQFGVIKMQSPVHEGIECRRPENKPKNRYTNILPFDWSLVKLKTRVSVPFSEYINATYIPGEWGKDEYIATQGPVTETIDDFWRMVWEQDTPIVIMLTVFVQNNKAKCVMYWPEAGSTMVCGDILVTTKSSDSWGFDDQYRTREIHLKCNDQVKVITQYQMVEWPDYGCPDSPDELLDLVETVRQQCPDDRTRLVVHCSAGVGRTGTYIAVDRLRQQLDKKEPTDTIDIQAMISEMREYRPHMVQTEAQYTYIHDCVNAMLLRKHGQNVDNGEVDIYENTDYPRKVSAESTDSDNPTMSGAMPYPIKVSADSTDSDKPTMSGTMSMSVIV